MEVVSKGMKMHQNFDSITFVNEALRELRNNISFVTLKSYTNLVSIPDLLMFSNL